MAVRNGYKPTLNYSDRKEVLFFKDHYKYLSGAVLDIGCGTGNAGNFYDNYIGITLNHKEIENRLHDVRYMNAENLEFPDNTFDGFIMWDSLEHFLSPYVALMEAQRVLKEGGKGLIFMPGQNWLDCHEHLHVMTIPQMQQLLKRTFFELIEVIPKTYPDNPDRFCEGMAIYYIRKNTDYIPKFSC
jgi:ubiquinone/menaquinone biosynthesis C-methylase UbiE